MATLSELQTRLEQLDETIALGLTSQSVDGVSTKFDIEAQRKERRRIKAEIAELEGNVPNRAFSQSIYLGGF